MTDAELKQAANIAWDELKSSDMEEKHYREYANKLETIARRMQDKTYRKVFSDRAILYRNIAESLKNLKQL